MTDFSVCSWDYFSTTELSCSGSIGGLLPCFIASFFCNFLFIFIYLFISVWLPFGGLLFSEGNTERKQILRREVDLSEWGAGSTGSSR